MLHFFNPGHEYALLSQSPYYTSPANIVKMQRELASLALWYADAGDVVLGVDTMPSRYIDLIKDIKHGAQYIALDEIKKHRRLIKKQTVSLWGTSPQAIHFFEELNKQYYLDLVIPKWNRYLADLSSRKKSQECLSFLINRNEEIESEILPHIVTTLDDVEELVKLSPHKLLAKAPYSSSGRGLLWLPIGELTRTERQILHGILKKQSYVSIEKVLNKKLDFAMEFEVSAESVKFIGYSLFNTNPKGAYLGNYLGKQENIETQIAMFTSPILLEKIKSDLIEFFSSEYLGKYEGYIGVDMLVYENNGQLYLQPCVEINMRNNMGILAINLSQRYISRDSTGYLYIDFSSKSEVYEKHLIDIEKHPTVIEDGKIKSGYLPLCPINQNNSYRAYIIIGG